MGFVEVFIILFHPILALFLLWLMFKQLSWKNKGKTLKGGERILELDNHERWGNRLFPALLVVVGVAFLSNIIRAINQGEAWNEYVVPSNLHAVTGLIGSFLFYITWRLGRSIVAKREAKESWKSEKAKHRRAAELIIILGCIHAFLGFILILKII